MSTNQNDDTAAAVRLPELQDLPRISVLLIEDDDDTREILTAFLQELGISEIHEMSNGMDALKFIDSHKNWRGIVLCDWNMPRMSGAAFYRQISSTHNNLPFIMVTGRNDEDSVLFAKDNGIYAYLLKPVALEELGRKISKVALNHLSLPAQIHTNAAYSL